MRWDEIAYLEYLDEIFNKNIQDNIEHNYTLHHMTL